MNDSSLKIKVVISLSVCRNPGDSLTGGIGEPPARLSSLPGQFVSRLSWQTIPFQTVSQGSVQPAALSDYGQATAVLGRVGSVSKELTSWPPSNLTLGWRERRVLRRTAVLVSPALRSCGQPRHSVCWKWVPKSGMGARGGSSSKGSQEVRLTEGFVKVACCVCVCPCLYVQTCHV